MKTTYLIIVSILLASTVKAEASRFANAVYENQIIEGLPGIQIAGSDRGTGGVFPHRAFAHRFYTSQNSFTTTQNLLPSWLQILKKKLKDEGAEVRGGILQSEVKKDDSLWLEYTLNGNKGVLSLVIFAAENQTSRIVITFAEYD
jgi:hypothetical protein